MWASLTVPLLVMSVFVVVISVYAMPKDAAQLRMEPLLGYMADHESRADSAAGRRALVGAYVVGHFRDRITTRGRGGDTSVLSEKLWKRADSLVAAIPQVTVEQLRAADQLVDSTWNGVPPVSL